MREKCSGGGENICFCHERMKETKEMTAIIAAGVNPYSSKADDIRHEVAEHGHWCDGSTPCGY